jgi:hypothetical protein
MSEAMASGAPRLSIVIPTLNRARLLARALDSALAQTAPDIEIIVSDNGSRDETPAVLARYADPRLRLFCHAATIPADEHGNFLIAQCRSTFFLGLSDDDWLEPAFAAQVLALLDAEPGLAFAYTGCEVHYGDATVPSLGGPRVEPGADFLAAFYAGQREVCWCACVTRLADLRTIGPIPRGRIFGDMYYWTQIARRGRVGCIAEPLAHYTFMSEDNLSAGVPVPTWAAETRLLAESVLAGVAADAPHLLDQLRSDLPRFVARSTANQFVWSLLRGGRRAPLWRDLWRVRADLARDPRVWPRALATLLLPRELLRRMVLHSAVARGEQRAAGRARGAVEY